MNYNSPEFVRNFIRELPRTLRSIDRAFKEKTPPDTYSQFIIKRRNIINQRKAFDGLEKLKDSFNTAYVRKNTELTNELRMEGFLGRTAQRLMERLEWLLMKIRSGNFTREHLRELLTLLNLILGVLLHIASLRECHTYLSDVKDFKDGLLEAL